MNGFQTAGRRAPTLARLTAAMLRLGATGYAGAASPRRRMGDELVARRRWITPDAYRQGLALGVLLPGPRSVHLVFHLGYVRGRAAGALLAGMAFLLPSVGMMLALGVAYIALGGHAWVRAALAGASAAVPGILAAGAFRLASGTAGRDGLLWLLAAAAAAAVAMGFGGAAGPLAWILAGGLVWTVRERPSRQGPALPGLWATVHAPGASAWLLNVALPLYPQLGAFFAKTGFFLIGSGLAVVPLLNGGAVLGYHWINQQQLAEALALAMLTPGPLAVAAAFVGLLAAGPAGALVAACAVFAPCYAFSIVGARHAARLLAHRGLAAFMAGMTAAVAGAVAGSAAILARRSVPDVLSASITLVALAIAWRFPRVPRAVLILGAALIALLRAGLPLSAGTS